jgi:AraC-like DNA-binding protein
MADSFALVIQSFAEAVLGRKLVDAQVELKHRKPTYYRLYDQYLHCPVRFGCRANCFLIPVKLAREPNASGDPAAYAMAQEMCRKLLQQVPAKARSTSDRVRSLLLSKAPGSVTETDVASALFISKRTLARRLDAEGSSYRNIREQLLSELARRHLRESTLSVEAVAALLGYNDAAAFRKAFHRWYGQSPKLFRHQQERQS